MSIRSRCDPRWLLPFWISFHLKVDLSAVVLKVCSTNGFQNRQVYLGLPCSGKSYPQGWWPEGNRSVLWKVESVVRGPGSRCRHPSCGDL